MVQGIVTFDLQNTFQKLSSEYPLSMKESAYIKEITEPRYIWDNYIAQISRRIGIPYLIAIQDRCSELALTCIINLKKEPKLDDYNFEKPTALFCLRADIIRADRTTNLVALFAPEAVSVNASFGKDLEIIDAPKAHHVSVESSEKLNHLTHRSFSVVSEKECPLLKNSLACEPHISKISKTDVEETLRSYHSIYRVYKLEDHAEGFKCEELSKIERENNTSKTAKELDKITKNGRSLPIYGSTIPA